MFGRGSQSVTGRDHEFGDRFLAAIAAVGLLLLTSYLAYHTGYNARRAYQFPAFAKVAEAVVVEKVPIPSDRKKNPIVVWRFSPQNGASLTFRTQGDERSFIGIEPGTSRSLYYLPDDPSQFVFVDDAGYAQRMLFGVCYLVVLCGLGRSLAYRACGSRRKPIKHGLENPIAFIVTRGAAGLILLVTAWYLFGARPEPRPIWQQTTARVVGQWYVGVGKNQQHFLVFEFVDHQGRSIRARSAERASIWARHSVGDTVVVHFDQLNPSSASVRDPPAIRSYSFLLMWLLGLGFLAGAANVINTARHVWRLSQEKSADARLREAYRSAASTFLGPRKRMGDR